MSEYKGAERVTLTKVVVGDWLRTNLQGDGNGNVRVQPYRETDAQLRQVAEKIKHQDGPEYVLIFSDGERTEPRYGTTSHYRVEALDVPTQRVVRYTDEGKVEIVEAPATYEPTGKLVEGQPVWRQASDPRPADAPYEAEVDHLAESGERCGTCKGFGLVRATGPRVDTRYRTLKGAQDSQEAGRAKDCPTCEGTGLSLSARELVNA